MFFNGAGKEQAKIAISNITSILLSAWKTNCPIPKPSGMVIPGAWNFSGASKKLIPPINPAQKITQKIAINFFIKFKYHLKWLC